MMTAIVQGVIVRERIVIAVIVSVLAGACAGDAIDSPATTAGSGTSTSTEAGAPDQQATAPTDDGPAGDLPFESGEGSFEVDGLSYDPEFIVSCIVPEDFYGDPPHPESLNLRAFTENGESFEVTVTVEEVSSMMNPGTEYKATWLDVFHHRRGADGTEQFLGSAVNDPDGNWYLPENLVPQLVVDGQDPLGPALEPPSGFVIDGDHITGTLVLTQSFPEGPGTVLATFAFTIPSEPYDCDEL